MRRRSFFGMLAGLCVLPFTKRSRWPRYESSTTSYQMREECVRDLLKAIDEESFEPPEKALCSAAGRIIKDKFGWR